MHTVHVLASSCDGNRTLEARDRELTQGVFLVSHISNGFTRIRLTGAYPCKNTVYRKRERSGGETSLIIDDGVTPVTQTLHSANPAEKSGSDLDGAADTARRVVPFSEYME